MAKEPGLIVVDSAVWAAWFNGEDTPHVTVLRGALEREEAGVTPLIVAEVLQGFRSDSEFETAEAVLTRLPMLTIDVAGHVESARLYRTLRRRGITIRGTIDCIIAQTCVAANAELLTTDPDFAAIARFTPLRVCEV